MLYSVAIIFLFKILNISMSNTRRLASNTNLDSYSVSILKSKSSIHTLAQTIVFKLYADKYLEMDSADKSMTFQKTSKPVDTLDRIEKGVVEHFNTPKSFFSLLTDKKVSEELKLHGEEITRRLIELGLMKSKEQLSKEKTFRSIAYILLVSLGVTKLTMGLINNKPVGFLVAEIIFVSIVFFVVNKTFYLTQEGKEYLRAKDVEYSWVRNGTRNSSFPSGINDAVMGAALFGIASMYVYPEFGVLSRSIGISPYSYAGDSGYISSSNSGDNNNSGGCSSNSGCSSSSGCGGSGCGGGGCGGCGGS